MLLAGAVLLAFVWYRAPPSSPPLYDGLILHPQPYRYLHPPPGTLSRGAPRAARVDFPVRRGRSPLASVVTGERPPQAILAALPGVFRIPRGVTRLTLTIRPISPPSPIGAGDLDGNVYLFAASGNGGRPVRMRPHASVHIQLRKTDAERKVSMERYADGRWIRQPLSAFAEEHYVAADTSHLGYYALVVPAGSPSSLLAPLLIIGTVILIAVVAGLLALRAVRRRVPAA